MVLTTPPPSHNYQTLYSRMAFKRWMRTESRQNEKLVSLSSPKWVKSPQPSLERKSWPDVLIGPNESTLYSDWPEYVAGLNVCILHTHGPLCCWTSFTGWCCDMSQPTDTQRSRPKSAAFLPPKAPGKGYQASSHLIDWVHLAHYRNLNWARFNDPPNTL